MERELASRTTPYQEDWGLFQVCSLRWVVFSTTVDSHLAPITRCTSFTNLFCHETLHVSDSSSVHHQQFIHCTLSNGVCHTGL